MKIAVINGADKQGVTYKIKELFLEQFRNSAEIAEFYLPKDCPTFCAGCATCFIKGEDNCKNSVYSKPIREAIEQADLLVFATPAYVMHTTGAMKSFLDLMAFRWMPHRPHPAMFSKRAVIISQCLGAGASSAAKDIKDSLTWWGVSKINIFTARLMTNIFWDKLPQKKQKTIIKKIQSLSHKIANINFNKPAHTKLKTKLRFYMCRMIQKSIQKSQTDSLDCSYWINQGWLSDNRPWNS